MFAECWWWRLCQDGIFLSCAFFALLCSVSLCSFANSSNYITITTLMHTKSHRQVHKAIEKIAWFKASCWCTFLFYTANKACKESKVAFTTKHQLSAGGGLTYLRGVTGAYYFQKCLKTSQTQCCTELLQQNMLDSMWNATFTYFPSLIVFALRKTLFRFASLGVQNGDNANRAENNDW